MDGADGRRHVTSWRGRNGFRMMPDDELQDGPASAETHVPTGGQDLLLTYRWEHPEDGPQDGVLLVGSASEGDAVTAAWGDSWHQHPGLMSFQGTSAGGHIELAGEYGGGWGWQIAVQVGEVLTMTMSNVIPAEHATAGVAAGPYPVMVAELRSSSP